MVAYGIYSLLLTFSPPYYPSKCSESHAEYAPLPRIVYFVGKWAISGHPWATIFMVNEKSFPNKVWLLSMDTYVHGLVVYFEATAVSASVHHVALTIIPFLSVFGYDFYT